MSSSRSREASSNSFRSDPSGKEKRRSTIFSVFSSSSKKSTGARSSTTTDASVDSPPTQKHVPHHINSNRESSGSRISASHLQIPFLDESCRLDSARGSPSSPSPRRSHPSSPASRHQTHHPTSPTSAPSVPFPPMNTQTKVSPSTRPSQKFLSQMPLSLALKTATVATTLPVVKAAGPQDGAPPSKVRNFFFGSKDKPDGAGPRSYEFGGRSTYVLVHGSILRYHSAFGDDLKNTATPDSTHFLNTSSIVCVTDTVQGFKWVLEIRTWSKGIGIKSPIKKTKSLKNLRDRRVDLTRAPWGIVDGMQAWYLIFETPNLMTEWMTLVRAAVTEIKDREARGEKSAKTPKPSKSPIKTPSKIPKHIKSPRISSPTSSVSESLPSSPSSSRNSFLTNQPSNRSSLVERHSSEEKVSGSLTELDAGITLRRRSRQPSAQDIALTAFRISAYEDDLADFVPPTMIPETVPDIRLPSEYGVEPHHPPTLTPNLSHYAHKRASIISLQSRLSSLSSGPRSPKSGAVSPTSSPQLTYRRKRTLRRTYSGESSKTNASWKHLQSLPPPHPPPTGPLPVPPLPNYVTSGVGTDLFAKRDSIVYDQRESMILGISPVFETATPKTLRDVTPRSSPHIENNATMGNLIGAENMIYSVKVA